MWIDIPPKDTNALVNETVELECKGRGNPTPTITWKKDGQPINFASNPRYLLQSTGSLRISRAQKSDSGKYTCVATNRVGSKLANATLRVLSKFNIYMDLQVVFMMGALPCYMKFLFLVCNHVTRRPCWWSKQKKFFC